MQCSPISQKVAELTYTIAVLRRLGGYTAKQMADHISIPHSAYRGLENATVTLTLDDMVQIAFILGIDTATFF